MNRTLPLTRVGRLRARRTVLRRQAAAFGVSYALLAAALVYLLDLRSFLPLSIVIALGIALLFAVTVRGWGDVSFSGWGLHLDDDAVYLTGNPGDTRIGREEIRSVRESSAGLVVKGGSPAHRIWIPAGVEHYTDVKATLQGWLSERRAPAARKAGAPV